MVSHTFNFFLQDVQIPGALGIARPAQPPSRAPIGGPPPPRAIQGLQALSCGQPEQRPDLRRAVFRHQAHSALQSDSREPSPRRFRRHRDRADSRPPSRSRTPIVRRRRLPISTPPGSWQPNDSTFDPYQVQQQPAPSTAPLFHQHPYYSFPAGVGACPACAVGTVSPPAPPMYYQYMPPAAPPALSYRGHPPLPVAVSFKSRF